jgi:hypothetical protein
MVATSCLFFACKVEEQPRRLREVIDSVQKVFHKSNEPISQNSEEHKKYGEEIVALESCLLQTLGFNVLINHAHTVIIKTCQMIKAPRDLAEAAYLTATNSLILTNFCVKFSSEKVACFCIYLACKWTSLIIPTSSEGLQWYQYVKHDIVEQELEDISKEYLTIYDKCLPKIQKKLGKSKTLEETLSYDARTNKQPSQKQQHPHPQQHPNAQSVKKQPTSNPLDNMHPQHQKPQMPPNVNINDPQQMSNYQRQQQKVQHSLQNKQPPTTGGGAHLQNGVGVGGSHPKSSHFYQSQQYQQQQNLQSQNRIPSSTAQQLTPSQTVTNSSSNNPNLNKPVTGQPINGQSLTSNNKQPVPKSSFNSTNLTKTNGSSNNFNNNNNQPGASQFNIVSNNGSENVANNYSNKNNFHYINNTSNNNNNNSNNSKKPHINNNNTNINTANSSTNINQPFIKSSPSTSASNLSSNQPNINPSMKRGNEDLSNNIATAPNKIPKYVIDQKSAS